MTSLLVAFVLSAAPADAASVERPAGTRGYHQIAKDMREIMKREALAKSKPDKAAALCELCALYREVVRDPRLPLSDTLKEYKTTMYGRLTRSVTEIKGHLAREKRNAPKNKKGSENSGVLASPEASLSMASQLALMSYSMGGPAKLFAEGAAGSQGSGSQAGALGGPAMTDYGQDLIDLIQRTIAPDSWDVNGGPGSIVYYPGLMALVVRATTEVHGETAFLLDALRKVGP
jgi:hypothetical protein